MAAFEGDPFVVEEPDAKQLQIRLNAAGRALLKNFFGTVSDNPNVAQKEELLVKILAAGNQHYDIDKLSRWFTRTRSRRSEGVKVVLTRKAVQTLKLLLREKPRPTDDQICAWASIAGAQVDLVRSWVSKKGRQRPRAAIENLTGTPSNSLPLPSPTPVLQDSTNLTALNDLAHLFLQTPYPTDDTLKVWARNLDLAFDTVRDWVHAQRTAPGSQESFYDEQAKDHGPAQDLLHAPLFDSHKRSLAQTNVAALNEPFPLPPAFPPSKALLPRLILKLKPVDQNRRLLLDIAERMDVDDPPTTYANPAESGSKSCEPTPSELQPQESGSMPPKTMTCEQFLSSFAPMESNMKRFLEQVGKGALETKGWDKAFVSEQYQVAASAL